MLAVAVTLGFALYILGPDLFSRFALGFIVPRRAISLTRSEEVLRAVVWASVAVALSVFWAHKDGDLSRNLVPTDLQNFFSGLYSEQYFRDNRSVWFKSLHSILWLNICLLARIYAIVAAVSFFLSALITDYAKIRHLLRNHPRARRLLAFLVLPRIAPWHLLLSRLQIAEDDLNVHLDILTKQGILYQGRLGDKMLAPDGGLTSITLADPRRFQREHYLEAIRATKEGSSPVSSEAFWRSIPTNLFLIMGSEIQSINIRYVPDDVAAMKRRRTSRDFDAAIAALKTAYEDLRKTQPSDASAVGE